MVVLSKLAETVDVNGFYTYVTRQINMPSPASQVFNLPTFSIMFRGIA